MEHWMLCRGFSLVDKEHVRIQGYIPNTPPSELPLVPTSVDSTIPCLLDKLFFDTVSVRVMKDKFERQFFVFVRNTSDKKFSKSDMEALCSRFLPLADCILFAFGIQPQVSQACHRFAAECKHSLEILQPHDVTYNKLQSRYVPKYTVLNEAEIVAIEKRYKVLRTKFARLPQSDAMRYIGLRSGMLLRKPCGNYRYVP